MPTRIVRDALRLEVGPLIALPAPECSPHGGLRRMFQLLSPYPPSLNAYPPRGRIALNRIHSIGLDPNPRHHRNLASLWPGDPALQPKIARLRRPAPPDSTLPDVRKALPPHRDAASRPESARVIARSWIHESPLPHFVHFLQAFPMTDPACLSWKAIIAPRTRRASPGLSLPQASSSCIEGPAGHRGSEPRPADPAQRH